MNRPRRRLAAYLATPLLSLLVVLGVASPAAAVTFEQRVAVVTSFTQTSVSSYSSWLNARNNQSAWVDYLLDWSTDYCSSSPDNPIGFDFKLSCARHDFGYRNHKKLGIFTSAAKDRVDSAFYEDLKRKCATYSWVVRGACYSLAWTYYQAVRQFGSVTVAQADIDRAAKMKADALAKARTRAKD
ncbi:MAG: phospholipase [Hamadaea sp.]|nr:phospholipase [Hamadaea sp.]